MKNNSNGIHLPFGYDTLITVILVITGAVFGYAKFVNKISELENNMEEANNKIEELISKHIEDEQERYSEMEEQIKWYQKEFNLNPLSWRKKKKK